MPAYNAAKTIEQTWREVVAHPEVDLVIVVDDASQDETLEKARTLDRVMTYAHPENRGYGANQKTCYQLAIDQGLLTKKQADQAFDFRKMTEPGETSGGGGR